MLFERVDHAVLGEDPPVRVANPSLKLGEILRAEPIEPGVTEHDQPRIKVLGQGSMRNSVMSQPASQVELADR